MPTHSFTSSSESPMAWKTAIGGFARHVVVVGILFLILGEIWFRLPWTTKILVYEFDDERNYRLVGGQSRGLGLANFSVMSPPITINSYGFRNAEIDWTTPTILAVGSSQVLGPGIGDNEVWTAIVTDRLSAAGGRPLMVINAGTPGYGPYHQSVTVRRYLERHPHPRLLVVRAAVSDRAFPKPSKAQLEDLRQHMALSSRVRRLSEFLPFLVNKLSAQLGAIRQTFLPTSREGQETAIDDSPDTADAMWHSNVPFWRDMADLAGRQGIPVVFFIDGADGAPSAQRLKHLFTDEFGHREDVAIALLDAQHTGIDVKDADTRRRQYRERFQLGYDPHANARLHRLTAEFLMSVFAAPTKSHVMIATTSAARE